MELSESPCHVAAKPSRPNIYPDNTVQRNSCPQMSHRLDYLSWKDETTALFFFLVGLPSHNGSEEGATLLPELQRG